MKNLIKKMLTVITMFIVSVITLQAQIISFGDPQMLPSLLKYNTGVDKDKDGFISIQEANKSKSLIVISIDTNNRIKNFSGIEFFNTIETLIIGYCNIDTNEMNKIKPEFISLFAYEDNINKHSILNLTKYWGCGEINIKNDKDIKTVIFPDKSPVQTVWFDYTNIKELVGFENQSTMGSVKINHCDSITTLNLPSQAGLDISDSKNLVHLNNQSVVTLVVGNQNGLVIDGVNLTISKYENVGKTLVTVCVTDTNDFNQNHNIDWIKSRSWVGQVQYNYIQYDRIVQGCSVVDNKLVMSVDDNAFVKPIKEIIYYSLQGVLISTLVENNIYIKKIIYNDNTFVSQKILF